MLKTRLIMTLLIQNNQLVKGRRFDKSRVVDTIIPTIKIYSKREVDEIVIYDTEASQRSSINYNLIKDIAKYVNIPLAYGGGINTLEEIRNIIRSGADKVLLNTALYNNLKLLKDACNEFGNQCILVGIDVKNFHGEYYCFSDSGKVNTFKKFEDWVNDILVFSPGEIIITSIDNDGMMNGFDLELYKLLDWRINIPIIASGGAGKINDFISVLEIERIDAVAAASVFHFTEITPKLVRAKLKEKGFNVRK